MAGKTEGGKSGQGGEGAGGFMLALALVVIIGAGSGLGFGLAFPVALAPAVHGTPAADTQARPAGKDAATAPPAGDAKPQRPVADGLAEHIAALEPIIVNGAGPGRPWLRLEGAVAFATPPDKNRAAQLAEMSEDIVGFLRGTPAAQLEQATGLEFLREDLSELVRLRSKGKARRFILKSLVIE
jgi:flagellar FliL protein